jgi:hypothetical protein
VCCHAIGWGLRLGICASFGGFLCNKCTFVGYWIGHPASAIRVRSGVKNVAQVCWSDYRTHLVSGAMFALAIVQFQRWISLTIDNWQRRIGVGDSTSNDVLQSHSSSHGQAHPAGDRKIGSRTSDRPFLHAMRAKYNARLEFKVTAIWALVLIHMLGFSVLTIRATPFLTKLALPATINGWGRC